MWPRVIPIMKISVGSRTMLWPIIIGLFGVVINEPVEVQDSRKNHRPYVKKSL